MNNRFFNGQTSLGFTRLITLILIAFLLSSIGLGWLVNGILVLVGLILLLPIVAWLGVNWWLRRNLVQSKCPVCEYEFTGLNQTELACPNCNEPLKVESGTFKRLTPPGVIDVEAVEVASQSLEE